MNHLVSFLAFFLLFLSGWPICAAATPENHLVTTVKVYDNDTVFRNTYVYNTSGNKVLETKYYQQGDGWQRLYQTEWSYNDTLHTQIDRKFDRGAWQVVYKLESVYRDARLMSELSWVESCGLLVKDRLQRYEYPDTNRTIVTESIYVQGNCKLISKRETISGLVADTVYTQVCDTLEQLTRGKAIMKYNGRGHLVEEQQQLADTNGWVNDCDIHWYYKSGSECVSTEIKRVWNASYSDWVNESRTDFEYDSKMHLLTETYQRWVSMYWKPILKYDYVYDASGNQQSKCMKSPIYSDWRTLITIDYSNYLYGKAGKMESTYNFWGGTDGEPVSSFIPFAFNDETSIKKAKSIELSYVVQNDVTDGLIGLQTYEQIRVYPNPSDGIFYMDMTGKDIHSWKIVDFAGRTVKQNDHVTSSVIDLSDSPVGIYILRAHSPSGVYLQKIEKK